MGKCTSRKMAIFVIFIHTLAYIAWLSIFRNDEWTRIVGSDIFQATAPMISAYWLYRRFAQERNKNRYFWLFLSSACICYSIGIISWMYDVVYLRVRPPFPGVRDLFWILMDLLLFVAFNYLLKNTNLSKTIQLIYDTLIVVSVSASISWEFILKSILGGSVNHSVYYKVVSAGYPICDLAILFGLLCIFNSRSFKLSSKLFLTLFLGISSFLIADTVHLYLVSKNQYTSDHPIEILYNIAVFIIGFAAFSSSGEIIKTNTSKDTSEEKRVNHFLELRLWLPYCSVFFLFALMIWEEGRVNSIVLGSFFSISLIIFRQIFTLIQNKRLLERLTLLNKDLEDKVQIRTKQLSERNEQLQYSFSQVEYLAYYDTLTGLPNRAFFEKQLEQGLKDAITNQTKAAILFLDLDRFKVINDTLGHYIGDLLLKQVAQRLQGCIQEKGIICRQGGDEFFILLPDVDHITATVYAEKILDSLSSVFLVENHELFATASIGIAIYPDHGKNVETLIKRADLALYSIKNQGKNNFNLYLPEMRNTFAKRLSIENGLRKAIDNEEFLIYYQPKLDLKTNKIAGMEALIRWNHPEKGLIPPIEFIPIAEETGLINTIGNWVLQRACSQVKHWQEEGLKDLYISVNVSAVQFKQKDICKQIEEALAKTGLDPKYLILEVTESIMQNAKEASIILQELKSLGVKISLDDFGSGFSSLTQIKHLPIDILKIDKSFIDDLLNSPRDRAIVKNIIELGKNLNLRIVAEGVESEEQLQYLRNNGCDQIQGFILSRPLPKQEFENKLKSDESIPNMILN